MKCLLVVRNPSMPDILFIWSDEEFRKHIAKSITDRGLAQPTDIEGDLDISILTQYFSPIIASHNLLSSEMNCPYSSITCENDFIFVLKQFDQHVYLTVNGDRQESEQFLHKKLQVFHRIVEFFFGPVTEEIRPDSPSQRDLMWETLGSVLTSWCELYHREQAFLLEAVETLEVNQTLNELCIGLLEFVLLKFRSEGDKNAVHAMLVTGAKLLALYSSRNAAELHPADVLLIINLAQALYPAPRGPLGQEVQEDAPPQGRAESESRLSGVFSDGEFMSAGEGGISDGSQYYSPNSQDEHSPSLSDEAEDDKHRPIGQAGSASAHQSADELTKGERSLDKSTHEDSHKEVIVQSSLDKFTSQDSVFEEGKDDASDSLAEGRVQRSLEKSTSEDSHTDSWCDLISGAGSDMASIPSLDCTPDRRVPEPPNSSTIWYTPVESLGADDSRSSRLGPDASSRTNTPTAYSVHPPSPARSPQPDMLPASHTSSASSTTNRQSSTPTMNTQQNSATLPVPARSSVTRRTPKREKAGKGSVEDAVQMMVFLRQSSPHILQVVRLLPNIVLVVVTEVHSQIAMWVGNCLQRLNVLMNVVSRTYDSGEVLQKQSSVAKLDADLKQLGNAVKKSRVQGLQQVHTELIKRWTIAKTCGLTTNQGSAVAMTPRLEAMLSEMSKHLKAVFQRCYINRNAPLMRAPSRLLPVIKDVRASLRESLTLYHDYLAVKSERNITMTNYLEDFPGLVHFIHVNRTNDQLIAPSINFSCEAEHAGKGQRLLQEKVWSMVESCHARLQQGYILETLRQGDFIFSYLLYFEDTNGMLVQNRGIPKNVNTRIPGILAGSFFREVTDHAFPGMAHPPVTCYELFCIHLTVVPIAMVTAHVRRLRTLLGAGDAITPVNLL